MRALAPGYTSEIDTVDQRSWHECLQDFDDANIYQTWSYGEVIGGARNMSHLVLRSGGRVVAVAQARIARLPLVNIGIAYVRWGPVWRYHGLGADVEVFRQALRALRNEFVCRRGLALRLLPVLFDDDSAPFATILAEEGFLPSAHEVHSRTILMDLTPSLQEVRDQMRPHWKRELKVAERKGLQIVQGTDDELFKTLIDLHQEMVSRKKFVEGNDINQFRLVQNRLPENLKMRIMLARSGAGACAGLICSAIGRTAVYLFGATGNIGLKSNGSYLLQWKLIENLKAEGCALYDLNGINPDKNPGTYKFKHDLGGTLGREVGFLGRFDAHASVLTDASLGFGDGVRSAYRTLKARATTMVREPKTAGGAVN
ncbi:MAG TPA: peptidoglycan bridge formation glycyltransferase FemA/FemB family protein [Vicinamibacterales bacterium]